MTTPSRKSQGSYLEQVIDPMSISVASAPQTLARGMIVALPDTGEIDVVIPPDADTRIHCDFLENAANLGLEFRVGDRVLVMLPTAPGQNGCVLGRIGRYQPTPDHLIIEAGEMLTLRCGDSAIDLRKDGKLVARGKDVLTRAQRTIRIKGGTVAIN